MADDAPDSHIDHTASLRYWNSVDANINGMLGGFPQVSRVDLRGSAAFLARLRRLLPGIMPPAGTKLPRGVDCGAGIGRVTEGFLSQACEVVDVVEPVEKFARVVREGPLKKEGKVGDVYVTGLESWVPEKKYDLIWNQWCVGHLTDAQLVEYLKRCKGALTPSGVVVVKENVSTGEDIYDELDSSVTRTDHKFRALFRQAGMALVRTEEQLGFPKSLGLFPVRFYALRPEPEDGR
ncbi:alpha-N-methyltransferase NTM1 [Thermoascus aurantiacus ATCC 26904]